VLPATGRFGLNVSIRAARQIIFRQSCHPFALRRVSRVLNPRIEREVPWVHFRLPVEVNAGRRFLMRPLRCTLVKAFGYRNGAIWTLVD